MEKKNIAAKLLAKIAYESAKSNANSACISLFYQPKMPDKVKQLKRYK